MDQAEKEVMKARRISQEKALAILKWLIFDETKLEPEDSNFIGSVLLFLVGKLEPYYDKYNKETNNGDDDQTGDQPKE